MSRRLPLLAAFLAVWLATEGDVQLARALRGLIPPEGLPWWELLYLYVSYPPLWLAVGFLAGHFFLWLYVLARLELSVAVPITACSYVFNALLVQLRLGETVSTRTWMGTLLITLGVLMVTRSLPPRPEEPEGSSGISAENVPIA